jgi:hypothetical protein
MVIKSLPALILVGTLFIGATTFAIRGAEPTSPYHHTSGQVMLILRGMANADNPRGQLDDEAALAYAGRVGFKGEVLDTAVDTGAGNPQVDKALERIRSDQAITAIYGFSRGGYNARLLWKKLAPAEQQRIRKIVVIGSPGVVKSDFTGNSEVLIKADPPEGHMAGPRVLLESLDAVRESTQ